MCSLIKQVLLKNARRFNLRQFSVTGTSGVDGHLPLTVLTANENAMKEAVARLAQTHISPYVREMENEGKLKESVIKMLFENGVNRIN